MRGFQASGSLSSSVLLLLLLLPPPPVIIALPGSMLLLRVVRSLVITHTAMLSVKQAGPECLLHDSYLLHQKKKVKDKNNNKKQTVAH